MRSTHDRFTIAFLCGEPGSGKSYTASLDVLDRLKSSDFDIVTNLPLNVEQVCARAAQETRRPVEDFAARITIIPPETCSQWQDGIGGPWEYRRENVDLLLDEVHRFIPATGDPQRAAQWERWLGEARHEGWGRLVFITQDQAKVHSVISKHTGVRFELTSAERVRDPFFWIPLSSWFEVLASVTRRYSAPFVLQEFTRRNGRLTSGYKQFVRLSEKNFALYNSYAAAGGGAVEGGVGARRYQYQQRPAILPARVEGRWQLPVWGWFVSRYGHHFAPWLLLVAVVLYLTVGGAGWRGINAAIAGVQGRMQTKQAEKHPDKVAKANPARPEDFAAVINELTPEQRQVAQAWVQHQAALERDLRNQTAELEAEVQELSGKVLAEKRLVAIHDGMTWWDSGEQVMLGERLEGGGPEIETLDDKRRIVAFVGGRRVRLGGVLRYQEEPAEFDPRLERGLPSRVRSGASKGDSLEGEADFAVGGVDAYRSGR